MKSLLTACALLLSSFSACAGWELAAKQVVSGRTIFHYVDTARLSENGKTIKFFLKETAAPPGKFEGRSVYRIFLHRVRCTDLALLEMRRWIYAQDEDAPLSDVSTPAADLKWNEAIPETVGERIATFVCLKPKPKPKAEAGRRPETSVPVDVGEDAYTINPLATDVTGARQAEVAAEKAREKGCQRDVLKIFGMGRCKSN